MCSQRSFVRLTGEGLMGLGPACRRIRRAVVQAGVLPILPFSAAKLSSTDER
jgi:hypothetical protein